MSSRFGGVTPRSVIIGFLAIIPAVFWGVYGDVVSGTDMTSPSLMLPSIFILLLLICWNGLIGSRFTRLRLLQSEMIVIYVMMSVAIILSGMGKIQFLISTLGALPHYKNDMAGWDSFLNYVPKWVMPSPFSAIDGLYTGESSIPWYAWWRPLAAWSAFFFTLLFCMLCINTVVRKQWMDKEKLTFPIVYLPLAMTDSEGGFFRNKLMWLGFGLAAGVETINSINFLYPSFPYLQIRAYDLQPYFSAAPWNSIGYFPTTFYPLAVGLAFLVPTSISLSWWFFFLLMKMEPVLVAATGWTIGMGGGAQPPFIAQQGAGGFIGLVVVMAWTGRGHLKDVLRKVFRGAKDVDDSGEPMAYRTAVVGLIAGFTALLVFAHLIGLSPFFAATIFAFYLIFATAIARIRAEAGPSWMGGPYLDATRMLNTFMGTSAFSIHSLVPIAFLRWFSIDMHCEPMPSQIEGMKMAEAIRVRQRAMMIVMIAAIVAGVAIGIWACLAVWYSYGAGTPKVEPWRTAMGREPFARAASVISVPAPRDYYAICAIGFGFVVTVILSLMRSNFVWFPLHPAGYVMAHTGTNYWFWMPYFIAWLFKTILVRYCGNKGYRAATPFFLGLILGDIVATGIWSIAGSVLGVTMYRCFPC